MRIEEAIVYVFAERNGGLKTEPIAEITNRRQLHIRKDGSFIIKVVNRGALYNNFTIWTN